ncbi:hypothetical protein JTB14_012978 [Gonioctena quinquepunctata]|nr:hypothetical protein JTB14_012978 [Gonioctena quinquepunctata]
MTKPKGKSPPFSAISTSTIANQSITQISHPNLEFVIVEKEESQPEETLATLNTHFEVNITETVISHIRKIENDHSPVNIVKFISLLKEASAMRNCAKLKGTSSSIANDTSYEDRESEIAESPKRIDADFEALIEFSEKYDLIVNPTKSKVMYFGDLDPNPLQIESKNRASHISEKAKKIGLIIDE